MMVPQVRENVCEPFALMIRDEGGRRRKLIWWYIAQVDATVAKIEQSRFDSDLVSIWVSVEEALRKLTFQGHRELVERAMIIVRNSEQ